MVIEGAAHPIFNNLDSAVEKEVVFDEGQSRRVDALVVEIQKTTNPLEKERLTGLLILNVHRLLRQETARFFNKFKRYVVAAEGDDQEDVYQEAVKILIEYIEKWQDQGTRIAKGEEAANFITFIFYSGILNRDLYNHYVRRHSSQMRRGSVASISELSKGDDNSFLEATLQDGSAEPLEHVIVNRLREEEIIDKIYTDQDPFLSLIIILHAGLSREILLKWKNRFDLSMTRGAGSKVYMKYTSKIDNILEKYFGGNRTLEEVGELLGISKQAVAKKITPYKDMIKELVK